MSACNLVGRTSEPVYRSPNTSRPFVLDPPREPDITQQPAREPLPQHPLAKEANAASPDSADESGDDADDVLLSDFACAYCEQKFLSLSELKKHMVKHNLSCPECKAENSTKEKLIVSTTLKQCNFDWFRRLAWNLLLAVAP